eukprot:gnl/Trimastix_PCT/1756.p1 GENE.gnl/Trimastix_PCT/1756~~gnl/Trimastix_PCT/1756.p1  ORF type:complete len:301 (+),score=81.84 gnl/Trimastix_PCT/1756:23-904(+)
MAARIIKVRSPDGKRDICTVSLAPTSTVRDLKDEITKTKKLHYTQQRITLLDKTVLENGDPISKITGDTVTMKNLGPQVWFRTCFIIEYLGPWILYPIFALPCVRQAVYGDASPISQCQQIALALWFAHYSKRLLETIFVHEFGDLTMPRFNIFKNSTYYWAFGIFVGYQVNHPRHVAPSLNMQYIGAGLFVLFALLNGICHIQLRMLRTPGSSELKIPRGFLFELVSLPNYLCEILTWTAFNILTNATFAGVLFNICGAWQMHQWARQRHTKYLKQFPDYPKRRKILIPFVY